MGHRNPIVLLIVTLGMALSPSSAGAAEGTVNISGVALALQVTKPVYGRGEPVRLRLILNNGTDTPLVVRFPTDQRYTLSISTPSDHVRTLSRRRPTQREQVIRVRPGQSVVFEETWDQRDENGIAVGPSTYLLSGVFMGSVWPAPWGQGIAATRSLRALIPWAQVRLPEVRFEIRR